MIEQAPLVEGAPIVHKVTIEGSALKPKTHYVLKKGILIINGQVPNGASVKVRSGRIVVRGDVGAGVRLAARMPEKTQRESYTCMRYDVNLKVNLPMTCHRTVRLGLAYPSETPGIDITGYVDDKAKVSSNAGVRATCVSPTARFGTDWEKPISVKAVGPIESCPRRF